MLVESAVVLSMYWPQSIGVSPPVHTSLTTSWLVTSNNAVKIQFLSPSPVEARLSGYQSLSGRSIMPSDDGTFTVTIDRDADTVLVVIADEQ